MRVLLVEDDLKLASFTSKGLKEAGFAVDHCADGEDGLHMALSEAYDAAIIDIMLPKLDGLTLIDELRKIKNTTPAGLWPIAAGGRGGAQRRDAGR